MASTVRLSRKRKTVGNVDMKKTEVCIHFTLGFTG